MTACQERVCAALSHSGAGLAASMLVLRCSEVNLSNPSREHRVRGSALLGVGGVVARNNVNVNHTCLSHTITASRAPSAVISSGSTTEARQTHREEHEARARTTPVLCAAVGRRTTMWVALRVLAGVVFAGISPAAKDVASATDQLSIHKIRVQIRT